MVSMTWRSHSPSCHCEALSLLRCHSGFPHPSVSPSMGSAGVRPPGPSPPSLTLSLERQGAGPAATVEGDWAWALGVGWRAGLFGCHTVTAPARPSAWRSTSSCASRGGIRIRCEWKSHNTPYSQSLSGHGPPTQGAGGPQLSSLQTLDLTGSAPGPQGCLCVRVLEPGSGPPAHVCGLPAGIWGPAGLGCITSPGSLGSGLRTLRAVLSPLQGGSGRVEGSCVGPHLSAGRRPLSTGQICQSSGPGDLPQALSLLKGPGSPSGHTGTKAWDGGGHTPPASE